MSIPSRPPHQHRPVPAPGSIIVGFSGSPAGRAALEFAAHFAAHKNVAVHCVRVWCDVGWLPSATYDAIPELIRAEHHGQELLLDATTTMRARHPGVAFTGEFAPGDVYSILQARSSDAVLLVVGAPAGEVEDHVGGSVGGWLRDHCRCPVAVIDETGRDITAGVPTTQLASTT